MFSYLRPNAIRLQSSHASEKPLYHKPAGTLAVEQFTTQLDLFLDSRSVVLTNEAIAALAARDAERAASSIGELRNLGPEDPNLPTLDTLASALKQWCKPAPDRAAIARSASWLDDAIAPAASRVLGGAAAAFMGAFFRDLAEVARGLAYEPTRPAAYRASLCLRCGEWAEAEEAALAIPRPQQCPDALHWVCIARYRSFGLTLARSALFALAWHEPQRLARLLGELGDESVEQDWQTFECASDWGSVEETQLPAWFPAWYLLQHPGMGTELHDVVFPDTQPAQAARLVLHLIELERQGNWRKLTVQREQLRQMNPDLFALYMGQRSVRYLL
jgi:hypothetical protein